MKRPTVLLGIWLGLMGCLVIFVARHKSKPVALNRLWVLPRYPFTAVTTQGIRSLNTDALRGTLWVADFIFTRCGGPCPLMSAKMAALQQSLPPEVKLVSFTVDPEHDTPAVLQAYAKIYHADPSRWFFARTSIETLYKMAFEGFKISVAEQHRNPPKTRVLHSTHFVLVDSHGYLRAYYDSGREGFQKNLERDVRTVLAEKTAL